MSTYPPPISCPHCFREERSLSLPLLPSVPLSLATFLCPTRFASPNARTRSAPPRSSIGADKYRALSPRKKKKKKRCKKFPERRRFFRAFFGQAEKEMAGGSMAYYLLKLFASRPARWLDRVVIGAFVAAPAMAHVEIAKRRWDAWLALVTRLLAGPGALMEF